MNYSEKVYELLELLEDGLVGEIEEEKAGRIKKALNYEAVEKIPLRVIYPNRSGYEPASMECIHQDMDAMMYNELIKCLPVIELRDDSVPMIRANYGTGTLPSLFGAKYRIMGNNMPWVSHLTQDQIDGFIRDGMPKLSGGLSGRVTATHEHYHKRLAEFPKCKKYIRVYHADLQGPFDVAHLLWGSGIYMEMYDDPDRVKAFLNVVTDTYIAYMKQILQETNAETGDGYHYHWSSIYKGRITLREDSSVNLSREFYEEFIKPCNERIADAFAPITMHFCGRADQWVHSLIDTRNIQGLNFGYMPGKFDNEFLKFIHKACCQKGVSVQDYKCNEEEFRVLDRSIFETGITYGVNVKSFENTAAI